MRYQVRFGQSAPVAAEGSREGNSLSVKYGLDGVNYVLSVSPDKILHKTVGDGLEVEFIQGKRTVGTLRCGNSSAPYPVLCSLLNVEECGSSTHVKVVFDDGDGQKTVDITLTAADGR